MRALIQQIHSGLYWKTGIGWVKDRQEAEGFATSNAAILFCVATEMRDTRIVLNFDDPKLDIFLHPFGERGYEPTTQELIGQSLARKQKSNSLTKNVKAALAGILQTIAAMKERRKQLKFKRKNVGEEEP